jgi:hypothetical protein
MNIYSNEDVFGMAVIFGTAGVAPPTHFLRYGFQMLTLNENWATIEPELGNNSTSTGCQFENFTSISWFSLFLMGSRFFLLGHFILYSAHSLHFAACYAKPEKIKNNPAKRSNTRRTPRHQTSKPLAKTKPTPDNTAKTVKIANTATIATTGMTETKKVATILTTNHSTIV